MLTTQTISRKHRGKMFDIGLGNDLLDITLTAKKTKAEINKLEYFKLKHSGIRKEKQL